MRQRDFRPAAVAVARLILRACGWEPIYESAKDVLTIGRALAGTKGHEPSTRQIGQVVDWAQSNLSSVFDVEYGGRLATNDLNAAVLAVADLINMQEVDDLLLRAVTDSSALELQLLNNGGRTIRSGLLSENAISAFDIILRSSCRHLAEVTLSAPQFGPIALQQLLRSSKSLEQISRQILHSVSSSQDLRHADEQFAKFTSRYVTRLREQLDFLDIPGVDLESQRQRYSLSASYIPLRTSKYEFTTLESLMSTDPFLLVAGEPGGGKSTLLKWAAVQLAQAYNNQVTPQTQIPFLIKLRSLHTLPSLDDIGSPFTEGLVIDKPSNWSRDIIESGRGILLFDGLDEVPEHRRESVTRWIGDIYQDLARRGVRVIVTSRATALRDSRFKPSNATYATLLPMRQSHVEKFVRVWHGAVLKVEPGMQEWTVVGERLLARLETNSDLARIASNPLLCAVICALYHARNQQLPSERSEIYGALMPMLLNRRDAERDGIQSLLMLSDVQRIMEDVAKAYLFNEETELPREEILGILGNSLRLFRSPNVHDLRPSIVLDYLISRTNVLREPPPYGHIDFWHKSFQEYLAARALVAHGDDQILLSHCEQAVWREVLIWACSFMPMERASALIVALLSETPTRAPRDQDYLSALALSCAHYTLQLSEEAQAEVHRCASRFIPPRTPAQLDAIVKLGQAAVPFLEQILCDASAEGYYEDTIVALLRIGGEAANTALSLTTDDFKLKWAALLGEGWLNTGSKDYALRVLGNVPESSTRRCRLPVLSLRQLREIEHISRLYRPIVSLYASSIDVDALESGSTRLIWRAMLSGYSWHQVSLFLGRYPTIRELILENLSDFPAATEGQPSYPAVRHLTLAFSKMASTGVEFDALHMFPCLESLSIIGVSYIRRADFSVSIVRLYCSPWPDVSLESLREMAELRELYLPNSPALESLKGIQSLPQIGIVDVSRSRNLCDIEDALRAPNLAQLKIKDCDSISPPPLPEAYSAFIDFEDDDLGKWEPETELPGLVFERWRDPRLTDISDAELILRGWSDWSFWDEIRGDADEWNMPDPLHQESVTFNEEGLTLYSSFGDWIAEQRRADRGTERGAEEEAEEAENEAEQEIDEGRLVARVSSLFRSLGQEDEYNEDEEGYNEDEDEDEDDEERSPG